MVAVGVASGSDAPGPVGVTDAISGAANTPKKG